MALSSATRTALALRTSVEYVEKKTHSLRWNSNNSKHEVLEHMGGKAKVVFASSDKAIAQRPLDRFEFSN